MTLADFASIGELLGGIAVVVSLVYLALQIRQNTRAVRSATLHQNTDLWNSLFLRMAEPELAQAYVAGLSGNVDIRPLHYTQFFFLCRSMFIAFENQYFQYREGSLDADTYLSYEQSIASQVLAYPGFRLWWRQSRLVFSAVFVDRIDAMIRDTPEIDASAFIDEWRRLASEKGATRVAENDD